MIGRLVLAACGVFALAFPGGALAADSVWSRGGPSGGNVTVLAADPQHATTIYAGTLDGGIWKTTDGASHWKPAYAGLPAISGRFAPINAIAVDPAVPSRIYAAMNIGLYKSDDGGATWTESGASVLEGKFLNAIAIDPSSSSTVYVGTSSGVYASTDAGVNWKASNSGLVDGSGKTPGVEALTIDPFTPSLVMAGTNGGTFGSTDGGATWKKFGGTLLDEVDVTAIVFDPGDETRVYALSPEIGLLRLVAKSSAAKADQVVSLSSGDLLLWFWEEWGEDLCGGSPCEETVYILFLPPKPLPQSFDPFVSTTTSEILIGTSGRGLFHSLDGGVTFTAAGTGLPSLAISAIAGDSASQTRYAGSGLAGVAKTTDDAHWAAANTGLLASEVYAVAASKSTPSVVYAATGSSIFKSSDAGVSWQESTSIGVDQQVWPVLAVDPTNASVAYTATDEKGILKTTDGGRSWIAVDTGLTTTAIGAIAIDPTSAQTIYAATADGMYKSADGAAHWSLLDADLSSVHALAIDPVSHHTVYAGGFGGVFRSIDGGASWARISGSNGFVDQGAVAVAVDPSSPTAVYVANGQGIFKTTDGGASWSNLDAGLPDAVLPSVSAVAIKAGTPSTIYVGFTGVIRGAGDGVYKSTNGGGSWTAVQPGLDNGGVEALAVSSGSTPIVYAGTAGGGVFRSPAAAPPPPPGKRRIIPAHPAPPKRVKRSQP